jgi:5-formyltetrahydrofolate cyclo-ligase
VIVPALAFTPDGRRLGRGKGYYDRALARLKHECAAHGWLLTLAGYCFDFQIIDDIPVEEHDICVDVVFC